ncbi:hypothetical protein ACX40Y_06625 [Sphingomonas sp. RS6]
MLLPLLLAGCGGAIPAARPASGYAPAPAAASSAQPANLAAIRGRDAAHLIARFGKPHLDLAEGRGRKLQFAGPICVLDAYLYPPASGRGAAVVTWIDARQRDGSAIDQASCVAALTRRR